MERKSYQKDEVIFRQGDPSDCMFAVESGRVGIFLDYQGPNEVRLTQLQQDSILGEMGLLDKAPRSATAVALCDGTVLRVIKEEVFQESFQTDPEKMMTLLRQMSTRLRRISRDYADACRTVGDVVEAEKTGEERNAALENRVAKTLAGYEAARLEGRE